jgi:aspartate racemase
MKTIGLLGGMSWESSLEYYKQINEHTNNILANQNNAKSVMVTVNFEEIEKLQHQNNWIEASKILINACKDLQNANADFIVICTNTMHKLLPHIKPHINIPFLHIADATASEINKQHIKKVLLLGTKFTMTEDFYKNILLEHNIEVSTPNTQDIDTIHTIIYNELCLGKVKESSKQIYLNIIAKQQNIDGVILGCTEIGMLINQDDLDIRVFDTTKIHSKYAVDLALDI